MTGLNELLNQFRTSAGDRPSWDQHIPDSVYLHIGTLEDFILFVGFINESFGTEFVEYNCENTLDFLNGIVMMNDDEDAKQVFSKYDITNDWGKLAYFVVISLSNNRD